jgi:hypothetical protein
MESFALASVIAPQYRNKKMVPVLAYGLAALVSASRLSGRQHFGRCGGERWAGSSALTLRHAPESIRIPAVRDQGYTFSLGESGYPAGRLPLWPRAGLASLTHGCDILRQIEDGKIFATLEILPLNRPSGDGLVHAEAHGNIFQERK